MTLLYVKLYLIKFFSPFYIFFNSYRFTKLTIDPQVHALNEESVDVIFIATDSGVILKAINTPSAEHDK